MILHWAGQTDISEDFLYTWMLDNQLSRHSGYDLAKTFNHFCKDYRDTFTQHSDLDRLRQSIDDGFPSIIHGYFTSFGHIIVVSGYDDTGFIVNDPYGEWFSTGYRRDLSGANLHYSTGLITRTSFYDGNLWQHIFSKR